LRKLRDARSVRVVWGWMRTKQLSRLWQLGPRLAVVAICAAATTTPIAHAEPPLGAAPATVTPPSLAASAASAPSSSAAPLPSERLAAPILICDAVQVIEWRASRHFASGASPDAVKALSQLCKKAIENYPAFLAHKRFKHERRPLRIDVSLLPANILLDGKESRNLNDVPFRFHDSVNNCCYWGLYVDVSNALYLRNDVITMVDGKASIYSRFARTFFHEMGHVMNHQWRVRELNLAGGQDRDEVLTEEWVTWLGYQFKTESSEDDLTAKQIPIPPTAAD
jgi:hypothetical protein